MIFCSDVEKELKQPSVFGELLEFPYKISEEIAKMIKHELPSIEIAVNNNGFNIKRTKKTHLSTIEDVIRKIFEKEGIALSQTGN